MSTEDSAKTIQKLARKYFQKKNPKSNLNISKLINEIKNNSQSYNLMFPVTRLPNRNTQTSNLSQYEYGLFPIFNRYKNFIDSEIENSHKYTIFMPFITGNRDDFNVKIPVLQPNFRFVDCIYVSQYKKEDNTFEWFATDLKNNICEQLDFKDNNIYNFDKYINITNEDAFNLILFFRVSWQYLDLQYKNDNINYMNTYNLVMIETDNIIYYFLCDLGYEYESLDELSINLLINIYNTQNNDRNVN